VERPWPATVALAILVASCVVKATIGIEALLSLPQRWDAPEDVFVLITLLVGYGVAGGLVVALAYRRRWAWWGWLVFSVLELPFLWTCVQVNLGIDAFAAARWMFLIAAEVVTVVLLLLRSSRQWYGVGRKPGGRSPWRWSDSPKEP
jgi:hypothetical protein